MKDLDLTKEIIVATRNATLAYYNYMYTDREYVKGQKLYLREMHFLLCVGERREITMSEIADNMNITQGAATQIASRLINKKLVCKNKSDSDKRLCVISLTPEGERAYNEYLEYDRIHNEEIAAWLDEDFSEDDIKVILRYENLIQDICAKKLSGK